MKRIKSVYKKVDYSSLSLIAGNMGSLHEEGISLLVMMDLLMELPIKRYYKESIRKIKFFIKEGKSLEECFRYFSQIYPELFIGMISIGEKSGNLSQVLKGLEKHYSNMKFIISTAKNILAYPVILLVSIIVLLLFIVFIIIPNLYDFYVNLNVEIPFICKKINNLMNYTRENPVIFLIYLISWGILVPYIIFKLLIKDAIKNLFSKFLIVKEFHEFIFISLLTIIIKSGVNISKGLEYSALSFKSSILKKRFVSLNNGILLGKSISETLFESESCSKYTIAIIKLGEEGGAMEERLNSLSTYLEKKFLGAMNKYISFLQPAMVLIMGALVINFIMIFILPLFNSLLESSF